MAVVTTKSGNITNRDSSPVILSNSAAAKGLVREASGTIECLNGDSIGSKYIFCSVPSNACIAKVAYCCDAVTSGAGDVGIYQTTVNGGAVVVAAAFASAVSIAAAISTYTDITHEADPTDANPNDYGLADVEKFLWQVLNLAADPNLMYDVVMTLTAATTAAGTVSLKVQWRE